MDERRDEPAASRLRGERTTAARRANVAASIGIVSMKIQNVKLLIATRAHPYFEMAFLGLELRTREVTQLKIRWAAFALKEVRRHSSKLLASS